MQRIIGLLYLKTKRSFSIALETIAEQKPTPVIEHQFSLVISAESSEIIEEINNLNICTNISVNTTESVTDEELEHLYKQIHNNSHMSRNKLISFLKQLGMPMNSKIVEKVTKGYDKCDTYRRLIPSTALKPQLIQSIRPLSKIYIDFIDRKKPSL